MRTIRWIASLLLAGVVSALATAQAPAPHDKAYWQAIIKNEFAVPPDDSASALAEELKTYLQSPDPEWRDEIAATIFTTWIAQKQSLPKEEVLKLSNEWIAELQSKDFATSDATVGRTFSALMLAIVIYGDNHTPTLDEAQYRRILQAGLTYLAREKDLRGFDPHLGWIHGTAHTADLLKFAARSRYFTQQDQATMLAAIRQRMLTAHGVFIRGEDERLARAILSILNRKDFDADGFRAWTQSLKSDLAFPKQISVEALDRRQNLINLCSKLEVVAAEQPDDAANAQLAKQSMLEVLKTSF